MALLETAGGLAVGYAAGRTAMDALSAAAGEVIRPLAKTVVRGVLVVSDGVSSLVAEATPHGSRSTKPRAHRTQRRSAHRRPSATRRSRRLKLASTRKH